MEASEQPPEQPSEGLMEVTAESRAEDPHSREDYEPHFDRDSTTRRVLGFITDQEDGFATLGQGTVPRNTLDALTISLARDENTPGIDPGDLTAAKDQVQGHLGELVEAGFVQEREDGSYEITDDGFVELKN